MKRTLDYVSALNTGNWCSGFVAGSVRQTMLSSA